MSIEIGMLCKVFLKDGDDGNLLPIWADGIVTGSFGKLPDVKGRMVNMYTICCEIGDSKTRELRVWEHEIEEVKE